MFWKGSPYLFPSYENNFIPEGTSMYSKNILKSIRRTTSFIIGDIIENHKKEKTSYKNELDKFEKILLTFDDDTHWETFFYLGKCAHLKGDYPNAYNCYKKSILIIESDKNLKQTDFWEKKIKEIKKLEKLALDGKVL